MTWPVESWIRTESRPDNHDDWRRIRHEPRKESARPPILGVGMARLGRDDLAQLADEVVGAERLLDEPGGPVAHEVTSGFLLVEAAHEDYRDTGTDLLELRERRRSVHLGHRQVQEHADDLLGVLVEDLQRLAPV